MHTPAHSPTAVIAAPLGLEHDAIIDVLADRRFSEHNANGSLFQLTELQGRHGPWRLVVTMTGRHNEMAAASVERAIATFEPQVMILAGVAGGRRGSAIGDVIAATEVYGYEAGLEDDSGYFARIKTLQSAHALVQQAHQVARERAWIDRIGLEPGGRVPEVFLRPLAAGGKVVASTRSPIAELIDRHCNDAQGVEMEGFGALAAAWMNPQVKAMVIRGVSDLLGGKDKTADKADQPRAARNAAAFAVALIERLEPRSETPARPQPRPAQGTTSSPGASSPSYTGAVGTGAKAYIGAIGDHAQGTVNINPKPTEQ